jgi:hypothetical protein
MTDRYCLANILAGLTDPAALDPASASSDGSGEEVVAQSVDPAAPPIIRPLPFVWPPPCEQLD